MISPSQLLLGDVLFGDEPADEFAEVPRSVNAGEIVLANRKQLAPPVVADGEPMQLSSRTQLLFALTALNQ